ncbi:hypothetical protein [Kosakonia sp. MUSA4]|uniref:hypothetical protein n=1 Tax=Kosakonia sp. MUSA4 TaxID=2067958 RepID=UPI00159AE174|nr:hypothetical protein [Kosakonia sp. MUSA4]QJT83709.1 hypothetical protein C0557_10160 [Kosakonia sp. MUSA4]
MATRKSWFQHTECTTQQADELVAQYRRRGVEVERSLNPDFITWTVSARLPEHCNNSSKRGRPWGGRLG